MGTEKRNIAIFYEHVVREYDACITLKKALERGNYAHVDIFSLQYQLLECLRVTRNKTYDAVVMPYVYTERSLAPIKFLMGQVEQPVVFNFHHEQTASPFDEHKLLPRDEVAKNKVVHLVWSEFFKSKLCDLGISDKRIFVTGNIRVNSTVESLRRTDVAEKYGLDENKMWILLCESGNILFSEKKISDLSSRGYNPDDLVAWNSYVEKATNSMILQINEAPDEFFQRFELIYRDHPGMERALNFSKRVKRIDQESIGFWLPHVAAVSSRISTVLFEAEKYGVPAVRYDPERIPANLLPNGLERYPHAKEITEILDAYEKSDFPLAPKIFEEYVGSSDIDVPEVISSIIKNELNKDELVGVRSRVQFVGRYRLWPRLLCNFFAPLILRYGVRWNCKFCSSFSNVKRDGPPEWRTI